MSDRLMRPQRQHVEPERFRRRQFVAPHRRRRLIFRLLKPFALAIAIVGTPTLVVGWVMLSDQFAVDEVSVVSSRRVPAAWAQDRLLSMRGEHLLSVDVDDVRAALGDHQWIAGVLIRRSLPDQLEVEIRERQPVALVAQAGRLAFVDGYGVVIAPFDPAVDAAIAKDFVLLSAPEDRPELVADALALVQSWQRQKLPWSEGLSEVAALTATDFRAVTAKLPCPVYVSSHNLAGGLAALVRYRSQVEHRLSRVASIDLRFRGRIVFQPAVSEPHNLEANTNA